MYVSKGALNPFLVHFSTKDLFQKFQKRGIVFILYFGRQTNAIAPRLLRLRHCSTSRIPDGFYICLL